MRMHAAVAWVSMAFTLAASAADVQTLSDGVAFKVGSQRVELRVASPHAFRLHVFPVGAPAAKPSIFLSPNPPPPAAFTITREGVIIGIRTNFGELKVDSSGARWSFSAISLLHGRGQEEERIGPGEGGRMDIERANAVSRALVDWCPWKLASPSSGLTGVSTLSWLPATSPKTPPLYYGSGSAPHLGELIETESPSTMGNGQSSLPQYWSEEGYGALVISASDDHPASWRSDAAGHVDWAVPGSSIDLYLAPAASLQDWLRDQAELTGFAPVPPRWAFGYLQSRWGWKDKAYIDETLAHFHQDQLPVDAFIFDFEWYTKFPDYQVPAEGKPDFVDFAWNATLFPDPVTQLANFTQQGLHMVGIRKPRVGNSANVALARKNGWILPSDSKDGPQQRNLDFTQPAVRAWYEDNLRKFDDAGVAGFWNDEGELRYSEYSYWNLAEHELLRKAKPGMRFWSINRSFAPGLQRFGAATWSGDISSDWPTLARTPGELLAYGLSGMPYSACDIGGFGGTPSPELMVRWMQAGVFFPVMRSHSEISQTPRFPWLYGPEAENAIRQALELRYRLIPYYYSLAEVNFRTAAPLMRPLAMEFPNDDKIPNETDEWLMGPGLMVAPILQPGGSRSIYLPQDRWYAMGTNHATQGPQTLQVTSKLDEIPVYVRAGTLLPLGPVLQNTEQKSNLPLELQVYPGRSSTFDFVEDDGATLAYAKGSLRVTRFRWDDSTKTLSWATTGRYDGPNRFHAMKAVLFAPQGPTEMSADLNGKGAITFPARSFD